MSEAVSALDRASCEGFVVVEDSGLCGMITLRGDLSDRSLAKAVGDVTGVTVPGRRGIALNGDKGAAWMSPDELLLLVPYEEADAAVGNLDAALSGAHFLAVNVSDARVVLRVRGAGAREVLGKLAPVDFSADAFGPGQIRRSRLAQVPAAFWMTAEDAFAVVAFRSVAEYVFDLLKTGALPGSEVGYP